MFLHIQVYLERETDYHHYHLRLSSRGLYKSRLNVLNPKMASETPGMLEKKRVRNAPELCTRSCKVCFQLSFCFLLLVSIKGGTESPPWLYRGLENGRPHETRRHGVRSIHIQESLNTISGIMINSLGSSSFSFLLDCVHSPPRSVSNCPLVLLQIPCVYIRMLPPSRFLSTLYFRDCSSSRFIETHAHTCFDQKRFTGRSADYPGLLGHCFYEDMSPLRFLLVIFQCFEHHETQFDCGDVRGVRKGNIKAVANKIKPSARRDAHSG